MHNLGSNLQILSQQKTLPLKNNLHTDTKLINSCNGYWLDIFGGQCQTCFPESKYWQKEVRLKKLRQNVSSVQNPCLKYRLHRPTHSLNLVTQEQVLLHAHCCFRRNKHMSWPQRVCNFRQTTATGIVPLLYVGQPMHRQMLFKGQT